MQLASWTFQVIPDHAPKIAMTKEPERIPRGGLKLFFKVEDDYGVVSAEARIRRLASEGATNRRPPGRVPGAKKGARPPYERPPALALRLPRAYPSRPRGRASTRSATIPGPA